MDNQNMQKKAHDLQRRLIEFTVHIMTAMVTFTIIAFSAILLGWMTNYLKSVDYPSIITHFLTFAEKGIFGINILLLVVSLVKSVFGFVGHKSRNGGVDE